MKPFLAAFFSLLVAGLGHFYLDCFNRGLLLLLLELATSYYTLAINRSVGLALNVFVSVWAALDAYRLAKKTGGIEPLNPPKQELFV